MKTIKKKHKKTNYYYYYYYYYYENIKRKTRKIQNVGSLQKIKSHRESNGKIFEYRMFYRVRSIVRAQTIFRA